MKRLLNTRKIDVEIVVCKSGHENGGASYFCRLFDMRHEFSPGEYEKFYETNVANLEALALCTVVQLQRFLDREHPFGDWFAIRFPQESTGIVNVYGQFILYQGLSSDEQREFFQYFAHGFKERGINRYCDKRKKIGICTEA